MSQIDDTRIPISSTPATVLPSFPTSTHDISTTAPNLITPNLIEKSPKEAAGALVTLLSDNRGSNAPDGFTIRATTPQDRLQIVQRMMQHGSPAYLSAFTNHTRGREIFGDMAFRRDATTQVRYGRYKRHVRYGCRTFTGSFASTSD